MDAACVAECDLPAGFALRALEGHVTVDNAWGEICGAAVWAMGERVTDHTTTRFGERVVHWCCLDREFVLATGFARISCLAEPEVVCGNSFGDFDQAVSGCVGAFLHQDECFIDGAVGLY